MTSYMICHIEDGKTFPLEGYDDTTDPNAATYDLMVWLDGMLRDTRLQDDHNLTVTSGAVWVVAPDAEYSVVIVEIPWYQGT